MPTRQEENGCKTFEGDVKLTRGEKPRRSKEECCRYSDDEWAV